MLVSLLIFDIYCLYVCVLIFGGISHQDITFMKAGPCQSFSSALCWVPRTECGTRQVLMKTVEWINQGPHSTFVIYTFFYIVAPSEDKYIFLEINLAKNLYILVNSQWVAANSVKGRLWVEGRSVWFRNAT